MKQFLQSLIYCKCFELSLLQSSSPMDGWIEGDSIGGEERGDYIRVRRKRERKFNTVRENKEMGLTQVRYYVAFFFSTPDATRKAKGKHSG